MPPTLYDYINVHGENEFKSWTEGLQHLQRGKLNSKLDLLEMHGEGLFPEILTGTDTPGIRKLRIKGNVQLRPMLCMGPINFNGEYTLLIGAIEVDGKLKPKHADQIAGSRRSEVELNPGKRRKEHEQVS